jgi:hypothetical protein
VWLAAVREEFRGGFEAEMEVQRKLGAPEPNPDAVQKLKDEVNAALQEEGTAMAFFAPRGLGVDAWNPPEKARQHLARRFMLLGQTADGMRVWDIRRAVEVLTSLDPVQEAQIEVRASGRMAVNALYAAVTSGGIDQLRLGQLPSSHRTGPDYLNVLRVLDIPQAVAMAAGNGGVTLEETDAAAWTFPSAVAKQLGWGSDRFSLK